MSLTSAACGHEGGCREHRGELHDDEQYENRDERIEGQLSARR